MSTLKILIVEDDAPQIETWKRQIDRFNAINELDCSADYAPSQDIAAQFIGSNKYDAAIIDIRLQNNEGVKDATSGGNEVRDLLLKSEIVLIAHVTGEPGEVHYDDTRYKDLVRVFTKADSEDDEHSVHEEILEWLRAKLNMISTLQLVKTSITAKMADLFYSSIWPRWDSWKGGDDEQDFVSLSVARHMSSHLYSEFLKVSEGSVHPEEWYFQPPSKERFNTGDIIKNDESHYILVTPRCDLERIGATDTLLFARMNFADKWATDIKELDEKIIALTKKLEVAVNDEQKGKLQNKIDGARSKFRQDYYGHKQNNFKYHFLPEINQSAEIVHGPFFVDFSNIMTISYDSDAARTMSSNKIAAVSPEFIPSLVQRLGAFMSRIGSPDYSHIY